MSAATSNPNGSSQTALGSGATAWAASNASLHEDVDAADADYVYTQPDLDLGGGNAGKSNYVNWTFPNPSIPAAATIDGVGITVSRQDSSGDGDFYIKDLLVQQIVAGSATGDDKADTSTEWPTGGYANKTYGSSTDKWGLTPVPSDYNNTTSGLRFQVQSDNNSLTVPPNTLSTAAVDVVTRSIYYTLFGFSAVIRQSTRYIPDIGRRSF